MLVYLPLEPYEERYTAQLNKWAERRFEEYNIDYISVWGEVMTQRIEEGQVLDGTGRPYFSLTQIARVMELMRKGEIKSGDKILTFDIWTFGLESIPYAATIQGKDIEIYGFNCAGTFEKYDFLNLLGMSNWGRHLEKSWFEFTKKIFFGSETLRNMAVDAGMIDPEKAIVTGLPTDTEDIYNTIDHHPSFEEKENYVVFPHRWDFEKRPWIFLEVIERVHEINPNVKGIITTGRKSLGNAREAAEKAFDLEKKGVVEIKIGLSKKKYYEVLARSKVIFSSALQDTVGNCMIEALTHGCTPVVNRDVSYHEYLPDEYLYNDPDEAVDMILKYVESPRDCSKYVKRYDESIPNMLREMELI